MTMQFLSDRRVMMTKPFHTVWICLVLSVICVVASAVCAATTTEGPAQVGLPATAELIRNGKSLFTGEKHFSKRGGPCIACHALRYPGIRGGNWGPDLTVMYTNLGEEGLVAVLKAPPFAGMKKMYEERPLTDDEIKSLVAFAKDAASHTEAQTSHLFPWAGIGFFAAILGIFSLYKRRTR